MTEYSALPVSAHQQHKPACNRSRILTPLLITCAMVTSLLLVATVVGFAVVWHVSHEIGYGRVLFNHRPGQCRQVVGPIDGSEGIELVRDKDLAFVTSGILYMQPHRHAVEGNIFLYDFKQNATGAVDLEAYPLDIEGDGFDKDNFHPHGITHYVVDGIIRLFVVNHDDKFEHSIEVFDFDEAKKKLTHIESIEDDAMVRPNDIVAVGPDQFIFTNDGAAQSEIGNMIETMLWPNQGSVVYYDGKNFHTLLSSKPSPNGIAYDKENDKLFVAMILNKSINVFDISEDKQSVTALAAVDVQSACDNVFVVDDGAVLAGCHPIAYKTIDAIGKCDDKSLFAPSQVLRLKFDDDYTNAAITEIYANDGRELSASTQAVIHKGQVLIGSVCGKLLHCDIADASVL